jgi:WD40 repeat protein/energy-coupling factor transporter ATP-binding protein EcfA2
MNREALVVGINQYPWIKDQRTKKPRHLDKAAADAEAVAKILEKYGKFRVRRLPEGYDTEGKPYVNSKPHPTQLVTEETLKEAIEQLFQPPSSTIPDTALLFFAGHGLYNKEGDVTKGFLATSDANANGIWGVSFEWLNQLLQNSPVRQQIVWLDCCYSGGFLNFNETSLGLPGKYQDCCFIAASRDFEAAYENLGATHGVFTEALLEGLNPERHPEDWVTNYTLRDFIEQQLQTSPQCPIFRNSGGEIVLTGTKEKIDRAVLMTGVCPYKGLESFEFDNQDPEYFYGRKKLTEQLLKKIETSNFLAVLGASGSGKSSLVKAGLLYEWKQRQRPDSDSWKILIFRPGKNPLQSLASAFVDAKFLNTGQAKKQAIDWSDSTAKVDLEQLVRDTNSPQVVLVVDQFEEVFTQCLDDRRRQQFFDCLLGVVKANKVPLKVIITMRADFFGKCTEQEYSGLASQIQDNLVTVTPMTQEEFEQAIAEPAKKIGLEIERELITQMLQDVEGPGSLPLLQYTLTELWRDRQMNRLTLGDYIKLGRVQGALQERADQVYRDLPEEHKPVAKRIFLELIKLGDGTPDTRKQVLKNDLINEQQTLELIEETLTQLVNARLMVTSELRVRGETKDTVTVIDIAHEALIHHWSQLQNWINESRKAILDKQKIEADAKEWQTNQENEGYLLRAGKLRIAENFCKQYAAIVPLSKTAQKFVKKSLEKEQEEIQKEEQRKYQESQMQKRRLLLIGGAFGVTAVVAFLLGSWIWIRLQTDAIKNLAKNSIIISDSNKKLNALIEAIKSAKALQNLEKKIPVFLQSFLAIPDVRMQVIVAMQKAVYYSREINTLEGHRYRVNSLSFSPDGKTLASVDDDDIIKLWQLDGTLLRTIKGHSRLIRDVSFSPDGKMFATASYDGTIKLWNLDGTLRKTLRGHSGGVFRVIFSKNQPTLVSASEDASLKFWSLDGRLLRTIQSGQLNVLDISFNPKNKTLASSGADGTVKLWDSNNGSLIKTFHTNQCSQLKCHIWGISYSLDGNFLATGSTNGSIKLWKPNGKLQGQIGKHSEEVFELSFLDDRRLASVSKDGSVSVWPWKSIISEKQDQTPDLTSKKLQLFGHIFDVENLSSSSDGKILASASLDRTVKLWNVDRKPEEFWQGNEKVKSISFSPDGKTLVFASHTIDEKQGNIRVWHFNNSQNWEEKLPIIKAHENWIWEVRFSQDSQRFASVSKDGKIKLYNRDRKLLASFQELDKELKDSIRSISFIRRDGKILASGSKGGKVTIWQQQENKLIPIQTLNPKKAAGTVLGVSFSPKNQLLAAAGSDATTANKSGLINLWKREGNQWKFWKSLKGKEGHQNPVQSVTFSPDGQLIASSSQDNTVKLWSLNGNVINTLYGHTNVVTQVTFSPDGQFLASGDGDNKVILWSKNGTLLNTFTGHKDAVYDVQFSPDGKTLASVSHDGKVIFWNLNLDDLLNRGCDSLLLYARSNPHVTSDFRSLCNREIEPKLLVEQGRDLAIKGDEDAAINKFKEAQEQGLHLDFQTKKEAERLIEFTKKIDEGLDLIEQGVDKANEGYIKKAESAFEAAVKLEPTWRNFDINPKKEAEQLYALELLRKTQDKIEQRKIEPQKAIYNYEKIKLLYPEIQLSAKNLDFICRIGSKKNQADSILKYCEDAVKIAPQNGKLFDNRGVARLFLKQPNIPGAIQDFQKFIEWTKTEEALKSYNTKQPQEWKKELNKWREMREKCIKLLTSMQKTNVSILATKNTKKTQVPDSCSYYSVKKESKSANQN